MSYVHESTIDTLNYLVDKVRNHAFEIQSELENEDLPYYIWTKHEKSFDQLQSLLRQLEDEIKYL